MKPYYSDDSVTLYHGDFPAVLAQLSLGCADLIVTDPPYGETSLAWDRWVPGWPLALWNFAPAMWCWGSMRMFLDRRDDFAGWKLSQDVVWEKHEGSGFATDRLRRVHEHALHFYRGEWSAIYHETPRVGHHGPDKFVRRRPLDKRHHGVRGESEYVDNGTRLLRSVVYAPNMHGKYPINETQKPVPVLEHLIGYGCPPGGTVLDPFAGSCSTLIAARNIGRKAIGIEKREEQCEKAARWLAQDVLNFDGATA